MEPAPTCCKQVCALEIELEVLLQLDEKQLEAADAVLDVFRVPVSVERAGVLQLEEIVALPLGLWDLRRVEYGDERRFDCGDDIGALLAWCGLPRLGLSGK